MTQAITTRRESLWIGASSSALFKIDNVVSSPEIADEPQRVDATNLASDRMQYVPGLKDYSGDLVWECNSQSYANNGVSGLTLSGNLRKALELDGTEVFVERRLPLAGAKVAFTGYLHAKVSGAEPNSIQRLTISITPTSAATVSQMTADSGSAAVYRNYCVLSGSNVYLSPYNVVSVITSDGSVGDTVTAKALSEMTTGTGREITVPTGYRFLGWCTDPYGEGQIYAPGASIETLYSTVALWPRLVQEGA